MRIAVVVSHPIQHFCPQYASWAALPEFTLKVFFASSVGLKSYQDRNFGKEISWNLPLDKFPHEFLNDGKDIPVDAQIDAPELPQALDDFKPELLIIYGYAKKISRSALSWARKHSCKVAYISDAELHRSEGWKRLAKIPYLCWWLFPQMDLFLTVGDANEAYYRYYGVPKRKMQRMHFSIDLDLYQNTWKQRKELAQQIQTKYGITNGERVISVTGKLVNWKSQDHLIQLLKQTDRPESKLVLFVLGSGPMLEAWQQLARDLQHNRVVFAGFVKPEELPAFYAASDVYIHPAALEPHSLAISEAIYMGCPVICSDRCGSYGPTDDVRKGINGDVYPYGDLKALEVQLFQFLAQAAPELEQMRRQSHEIAVSQQECAHREILYKLKAQLNKN